MIGPRMTIEYDNNGDQVQLTTYPSILSGSNLQLYNFFELFRKFLIAANYSEYENALLLKTPLTEKEYNFLEERLKEFRAENEM